ncbi:penicillin-binding protein 2 [Candidatus Omnitrophota bacterium]
MRLRFLKNLILFAFLLLVLGLVQRQIVQGAYYSQLSQNNRVKLIRLPARRGFIYDRQGKLIAGARASFNVALLFSQTQNIDQSLKKISRILGLPQEGLAKQYKRNYALPFIPVVVLRDISKEQAIMLECQESEIPGLVVQTELVRDYQYEQDACHILGYLGLISETKLKQYRVYGLRATDLVGQGGLEEQFDHSLRGQPGGMQVEVNNRGHQVRVLGSKQPQPGLDLHLTIDAQLQQTVNKLLEDKTGSVLVLNPQNGEVLAMVSKPGFAPGLFLDTINAKPQASQQLKRILNAAEAPLINRAISGIYPPGSIFKIVTAAAGLETAKILPQKEVLCSGHHKIGDRNFPCWNLDGHGNLDIASALAFSCNVFFYKLGLSLGVDNLTYFSRKFGLGQVTGIDLPYEAAGFVPSKSWKLKTKKERWYDGETANFSIGQGDLLSTPLQVARVVAAVANGGYLIRPHLVKKVGRVERRDLRLKKETWSVIKQGMAQAVSGPGGTAQRADLPGVRWAAKTGTAQASFGRAHGWFAGFYPLDQPQILVLVFLEYGGSGGEFPAMIAKQIIEYVQKNNISVQ